MAEVELGFLVVGGEFDVLLSFLVFHPEFVVRPGTDDVPCVPVGRDVVGMDAVVHDAGDIRAVGIALDEGQHDFCTFVQGEVDAVLGTGIGFGESDGTAFSARTPFVQIKRQFDAVAPHVVDVGVGAVLCRGHPCRQGTVDMRTRGGAFGTVGELGGNGGKGVAVSGIAAAAVFHAEYQPAVRCFGEGGIGLEYFHRCHGDDVAAAVGDGLAAEDGFVQQDRLNFGFVGGFGMKAPVLLFAQ